MSVPCHPEIGTSELSLSAVDPDFHDAVEFAAYPAPADVGGPAIGPGDMR